MKIGELKKLIENISDNTEVVIDTEARCFNAHLIDIDGASLQHNPIMDGKHYFIIMPNYSGSTHYRKENE